MLHAQIESEEVVERYVRNQLSPQDRQAFEEHFFACDECFEKLRAMDGFVAGVRDAAVRGLLDGEEPIAVPVVAGNWWRWAFAAAAGTAVALGAIAAWMFFSTIPALNAELDGAKSKLRVQRYTPSQSQPGDSQLAEVNVPLVILQASRGQESTVANLPADAKQLVVWIEVGPTRFRSYRMEILSLSNQPIVSVDGLKPGPYGALAVGLPAAELPAGNFRVTLVGQDPPPASLVGEYPLKIRKP
jgi:hypothetical protein